MNIKMNELDTLCDVVDETYGLADHPISMPM